MIHRTLVIVGLLAALPALEAQDKPARVVLDDFETDPRGWKFVGGEEFPGAKGDLAIDATIAHGGKRSYKLRADFTGGGAYVGTWKDLASLNGKEIKEIRLWAKAEGITRLGVRILDGSDQIHQKNVPLAASTEWQEVVLKIVDLVGGEHWGGANDGKWHGPAKAFGLNVGKDAAPTKKATLWIDDVEVVPGAPVSGRVTILSAVLSPPTCRPGYGTRVTFRWDAQTLGRDLTVFVHFSGAKGTAFQWDHAPEVPTSTWSGRVEYGVTVVVPAEVADGEYRVIAGLYYKAERQALTAGEGVTALGGEAFHVATLKIDSKAPFPKLPAPTLKLDEFKLTWSDEFDDLSVSAKGPGTRWIAHTPYWGDFGDAGFADPKDGFPFTVEKGILRIEARKTDGKWRAGLLSSVDPEGKGFSQKFGYFEMKAKFPKGPGMWPAFWLMGVLGIKDKTITNPEIDVVEQYGVAPHALHATLHLWGPGDKHEGRGDVFIAPGMTDDFHTYGALVEEKEIVWYWDGIEIWRQKTPEAAKVPLYVMVDLAMGGGWPIDKAPSPSYMYVDYVRAYARR
jgi:hypothetical protein